MARARRLLETPTQRLTNTKTVNPEGASNKEKVGTDRKQLKPPGTPPGGAGMSLFCFFRAFVDSQAHRCKRRRKQTASNYTFTSKISSGLLACHHNGGASCPVVLLLCSSALQDHTNARNLLTLRPNQTFTPRFQRQRQPELTVKPPLTESFFHSTTAASAMCVSEDTTHTSGEQNDTARRSFGQRHQERRDLPQELILYNTQPCSSFHSSFCNA